MKNRRRLAGLAGLAFRMDLRNCSYLFRLGQDIFLAPSNDPEVAVVQYLR